VDSAAFIVFRPFHLDVANEQLWREAQQIALRPKPLAILRYLVEHPGRLVTKEELLKAIWPDIYVSEGVLKGYVRDLRRVLEDEPRRPRFIETVVRRGYRFIAPITTAQPIQNAKFKMQNSPSSQASSLKSLAPSFVGREAELGQLQEWLETALRGERQVVFVTGEVGIGKTTVVETFLLRAATGDVMVARGQCIEHYGVGEAYLPILEAIRRICRNSGGERYVEVLRQHAPSWLVQMPALVSDAEFSVLSHKAQGATRERMLREMAEAVDVLTTETPLVLVLEDLQWSDYSTLDLLAILAKRQESVRLLVIGTYRPTDVAVSKHPLQAVKRELQVHGQCRELPLTLLTEEDVAQYLAVKFPQSQLPASLAHILHRRTDGNPLFLVNAVDALIAQGAVREEVGGRWQLQVALDEVKIGVPEGLRQMIEQQIDRLSEEEQHALEAASVVGADFSAAVAAAGLLEELERVEERYERLARRGQFLQPAQVEMLPDGTTAGRYRFLHTLYQNVLYDRLATVRRTRLHQRIGEREERAYGNRVGEIATELAVHFEHGQDYRRAVQYLGLAATNAVRRSAHREAISHATKALVFLKAFPDAPDHARQELALQMTLGVALMNTQGFAAPAVEQAYARVRTLCQDIGDTPQLFPALWGLRSFYNTRAEFSTARTLAEQFLNLAHTTQSPDVILQAHVGLGMTSFYLGDVVVARVHLEESLRHYNPQQHHTHAYLYGQDPGVLALCHAGLVLWGLGYPDQAVTNAHKAVTLAQEVSHPFSLAYALCFAATLHTARRESAIVRQQTEAVLTLSRAQGFAHFATVSLMLRGWALADSGQTTEGIAQIQQGLAAQRSMGIEVGRPCYLAFLAEAYQNTGQITEGLSVLDEAMLVVQKGEREYEAELYRLKGELSLKSRNPGSEVQKQKAKFANPRLLTPDPRTQAEAEACFNQALAIARRQSAKSLELRAAVSLSRLWQQQGKRKEARQTLAEIYGWFTEGFDTADLQEAKALLEELS